MTDTITNLITLDFADYTAKGKVRNLSGRPKGEDIRKAWKLDELETDQANQFFIKIPTEMYGLAPSLIQGLFTKTIDTIGKQAFYERYKFSPHETLIGEIKRVIDGLPDTKAQGEIK